MYYNTLTMIADLIALAIGCGVIGLVVTYIVLYAIRRFNIDITQNWWIVAIPVVVAVLLNVCLIELYRKFWKRQK